MSASLRKPSNMQLRFSSSVLNRPNRRARTSQHALNLMLNLGFERFHTSLTKDGAVHEFELGVVRNFSAPDGFDMPPVPKSTRTQRIVLWRTACPQGHLYASAFHDPNYGRCRDIWNREVNFEIFWRKLQKSFQREGRS